MRLYRETIYRSPGIYLTTEENLTKRFFNESCAKSHGLKWGPLLPCDIGRIAQHIREGEIKEERMDGSIC